MKPQLNEPAQNLLPLPARRALARTLIWFALPAFALGRDIILDQPTNITVEVGQTATFTVVAKQMFVGAGWGASYTKPKFEWFKGNAKLTNLPTSNSSNTKADPPRESCTLTLSNVQVSDAGDYGVIAYYDGNQGYEISRIVTLTVLVPTAPKISTQPLNLALYSGQNAMFDVSATGTPAPTYQWRHNGNAIAGATTARLIVHDFQVSDLGAYDVIVSNHVGSVVSRAATLTMLAGTPGANGEIPTTVRSQTTSIRMQPESTTVSSGQSAALQVVAAGENLAFQWKKNGRAISGATNPRFSLPRASLDDMGFYSVTVSGDDRTIESEVATLAVADGAASRLTNLSIRGTIKPGGTLTPGFTLRGIGTKPLLLRAIGPTLTRFGVTGAVRNPRMELIPEGATRPTLANDNWTNAANRASLLATTAAVGAFPLDEYAADAALLAPLTTNGHANYSLRIAADDSDVARVVLVEIYDADPAHSSVRLGAASTLGFAGAGSDVLVCGFTIAGTAPKHVVIRAVGPSLASFGVTDVLADPQLSVTALATNQTVAANDNWDYDAALIAAFAAAGAFPLSAEGKDAAVVLHLPPGGYTITVSGAAGGTGNALVELYDLDP